MKKRTAEILFGTCFVVDQSVSRSCFGVGCRVGRQIFFQVFQKYFRAFGGVPFISVAGSKQEKAVMYLQVAIWKIFYLKMPACLKIVV